MARVSPPARVILNRNIYYFCLKNAAESTLSVLNQDEDSGHGGSEPDGLSGDVMLQRRKSAGK